MHITGRLHRIDGLREVPEQIGIVGLGFVDDGPCRQSGSHLRILSEVRNERAHPAVRIGHVTTNPILHQSILSSLHSVPALCVEITIFNRAKAIIQGVELSGI